LKNAYSNNKLAKLKGKCEYEINLY